MIMTCASKENISKTQLFVGVLQFLTSVFLIGWIWALYWSYLSARRAYEQRQLEKQGLTANQYTNSTNQQNLPKGVRGQAMAMADFGSGSNGPMGPNMNNRQQIAQQNMMNNKMSGPQSLYSNMV